MSQSANNWASADESKNSTLANADRLGNQLAANLGIQLGSKYVKTTTGEKISEKELRDNQFISPLPVNLYGELVGGTRVEFNIADFQATLKRAAAADDPITSFIQLVQHYLPDTNGASLITRMPAVQQIIADALKKF
jgi:hypothetical protein